MRDGRARSFLPLISISSSSNHHALFCSFWRQALEKLGLKPVAGISRVAIRKAKNVRIIPYRTESSPRSTRDAQFLFSFLTLDPMSLDPVCGRQPRSAQEPRHRHLRYFRRCGSGESVRIGLQQGHGCRRCPSGMHGLAFACLFCLPLAPPSMAWHAMWRLSLGCSSLLLFPLFTFVGGRRPSRARRRSRPPDSASNLRKFVDIFAHVFYSHLTRSFRPPHSFQQLEGEDLDETGLDAKDIEMAMAQTNKSRKEAVYALKKHNGDIVNAIMVRRSRGLALLWQAPESVPPRVLNWHFCCYPFFALQELSA